MTMVAALDFEILEADALRDGLVRDLRRVRGRSHLRVRRGERRDQRKIAEIEAELAVAEVESAASRRARFVAADSGVAQLGRRTVVFTAGSTTVRAGDPLLKACPHCFVRDDGGRG